MGFFSNLWSGIKNVGSSVWNGLKKGVGVVSDIGNKIRGGIGSAWNFIKKIPVIGNLAEKAVNTPIPFLGGASLSNVAQGASTGLDVVNGINGVVNGQSGSGRRGQHGGMFIPRNGIQNNHMSMGEMNKWNPNVYTTV